MQNLTFDIFNNDAFGLTTLSHTMTTLPSKPGRITELGWFTPKPIATLGFMIESQAGRLKLVPAGVRGSSASPEDKKRRQLRSFRTIHLPQRDSLVADEVLGVRLFGTETELQVAETLVNDKLADMKANIDVTKEFQRIGAVKGLVLDADGSTVITDLFAEFGVAQQVKNIPFSVATTEMKQMCVDIARLIGDELGGISYSGIRVLCSRGFFDKLVTHASVKAAYDLWEAGAFLRDVQNKTGFSFGGIWWEEYYGRVGNINYIADGEAYAVPEGVRDQFLEFLSPADYMETINTLGQPYYAKTIMRTDGKAVDIESQSNPLHLNTRPRSVIKLVAA